MKAGVQQPRVLLVVVVVFVTVVVLQVLMYFQTQRRKRARLVLDSKIILVDPVLAIQDIHHALQQYKKSAVINFIP